MANISRALLLIDLIARISKSVKYNTDINPGIYLRKIYDFDKWKDVTPSVTEDKLLPDNTNKDFTFKLQRDTKLYATFKTSDAEQHIKIKWEVDSVGQQQEYCKLKFNGDDYVYERGVFGETKDVPFGYNWIVNVQIIPSSEDDKGNKTYDYLLETISVTRWNVADASDAVTEVISADKLKIWQSWLEDYSQIEDSAIKENIEVTISLVHRNDLFIEQGSEDILEEEPVAFEFYSSPAGDPSLTAEVDITPKWNTSGSPLEYSLDNGTTWQDAVSGERITDTSNKILMRGLGLRPSIYRNHISFLSKYQD
ncbi:hypothetical protein FACS1894195_0010 [Bacteroidia bacterium]|nr:hypothetical protein FACS1894195_0010 [Bacteroidia bacterium]